MFVADFILKNLAAGPSTTPTPIFANAYKPANNKFGKIPRPQVTTIALAPGTTASFSLSAKLPKFPSQMNVLKILKPQEQFQSVPTARKAASVLGFKTTDERNRLTEDLLFWQNDAKTRSLKYEKVKQEWLFEVIYARDTAAQTARQLLSKAEYQSAAPSLISQLGLNSTGYSGASSRVDYVSVTSGQNFKNEIDATKARFARIALYKKVEAVSLADNYKPAPTDPNPAVTIFAEVRKYNFLDAPAVFIVHGDLQKSETDILGFKSDEYIYSSDVGIYSIITPEKAWDNIQANKGYLIWLRPEGTNIFDKPQQLSIAEFVVDVNTVRLIYIEPDDWIADQPWTQFLQPFYIFEGIATTTDSKKAEFAIIIEALSEENYLVAE